MVKHEPELHITTRRHRCCTLLLYSGLWQFLRLAKVPLTRVEPRGLEPLTPCLQSKCATNCAMAPCHYLPSGRAFGPRPRVVHRTHTLKCVHCVCDQVSGTIHSVRGNRPDQVTIHVGRDRDRGVAALTAGKATAVLATVLSQVSVR
jgi:hypothetical protein